jgi:hypothetical protein
VNRSLGVRAEESVPTVTVMVTGPMVGLAGLTAMISVLDMNMADSAGVDPNITFAPEVNPMPVIVTFVLLHEGPSIGSMLVMAGW